MDKEVCLPLLSMALNLIAFFSSPRSQCFQSSLGPCPFEENILIEMTSCICCPPTLPLNLKHRSRTHWESTTLTQKNGFPSGWISVTCYLNWRGPLRPDSSQGRSNQVKSAITCSGTLIDWPSQKKKKFWGVVYSGDGSMLADLWTLSEIKQVVKCSWDKKDKKSKISNYQVAKVI